MLPHPLIYPDSAAPSQATPLSATTSFTYPIAAPAQVSYKTNPDQPLLSTSALPDRRHQWAYVHTPNTAHGQGQYPRNPYAYAYSQRRSASYNTTPSHSSRASIRGTRQAVAGSTSGSTGGSATWDMVRRHSDTAPHENGDADGH